MKHIARDTNRCRAPVDLNSGVLTIRGWIPRQKLPNLELRHRLGSSQPRLAALNLQINVNVVALRTSCFLLKHRTDCYFSITILHSLSQRKGKPLKLMHSASIKRYTRDEPAGEDDECQIQSGRESDCVARSCPAWERHCYEASQRPEGRPMKD